MLAYCSLMRHNEQADGEQKKIGWYIFLSAIKYGLNVDLLQYPWIQCEFHYLFIWRVKKRRSVCSRPYWINAQLKMVWRSQFDGDNDEAKCANGIETLAHVTTDTYTQLHVNINIWKSKNKKQKNSTEQGIGWECVSFFFLSHCWIYNLFHLSWGQSVVENRLKCALH